MIKNNKISKDPTGIFERKYPIIETHCHLDMLKEQSIKQTISMSKRSGITDIVTISVSSKNLEKVVGIAEEHDNIYCSQGIHPHEAITWNNEVKSRVLENINSKKVIAIGEAGLDYYYDRSPRNIQQKIFEEQLQIASDHKLPIIIHTREADSDTIAILKNFENKLPAGGVIHSFTSGVELAEYCIASNFYIGFNGIITFKSAQNVRDVLNITPIEQIVIETDAPFLTPTPHRGKENSPFYLPYIGKFISEEKNISEEDCLNAIYKNSKNLFNI